MSTNCSSPYGEIVAGLSQTPATISPKYFYDAVGSALFEQITHLPEYYPTRTERAIMAEHGPSIARRIAVGGTIIELGAGNCEKARALCALVQPRCYVPVDISADFLHAAVNGLRGALPALTVRPVVADLNDEILLPGDLPPGASPGVLSRLVDRQLRPAACGSPARTDAPAAGRRGRAVDRGRSGQGRRRPGGSL